MGQPRLTATDTASDRRLLDLFARAPVVAGALWAAHWIVLSVTGQPYSIRVIYAGWQFLPADALGDDPVGSVWNLHIQPPLWNLLVGGVDAWSPFGPLATHRAISLVLGTVLAAAVATTLRNLGASRLVAVLLTVAATMNSQVMANAFEPRYELAVTTMLAVLVWAVSDDRLGATGMLFVTVGVATALVMTRALYHPVWLIATCGVLIWAARHRVDRRVLMGAAAIPVIVVGGWIVKNELVFDRPTLSSWGGMNLLRSVEPAIAPDRVVELNDEGRVSGVAVAGHFQTYGDYAPYVPACSPDEGDHAVLAEPYRAIPPGMREDDDTTQAVNFNYVCYLEVYDRAGADARVLIRAEPGAWLRARAWAANNWFEVLPVTESEHSPLWTVETALTRVLLLGAPHPGLPASWEEHALWVHENPLSLTLMALTGVLLAETALLNLRKAGSDPAGGSRSALRCFVRGRSDEPRRRLALTVASGAVLWTMFAGIVFELGEQGRFRSASDPLVLALGGWIVVEWVARRRRSRPAIDT
jgi:hypothetical protein